MDELVEEHLDALGVVAEHPGDRRVPVARAVVVGAEHVDRPVEAALELVDEVDDVGCAVGRLPGLGAKDHAVLLVSVGGGPGPHGAVLLVAVHPRHQLREPLRELALERPRVEMDAEPLERRLDPRQHRRDRVALEGGELADVVALVAVLRRLLPAPHRLHRSAEELHLRAGVVVVVLALDLVPAQLEQARDRVADPAVPRRGDGERAGRVGGDHLDLDALLRRGEAGAVVGARGEDLAERTGEPAVGEEEVDEAGSRDLGAVDVGDRRGGGGQLLGELARRALA